MIPAIFGCLGPQLTAEERAFFREADPAGYILFGRNCENPDQLRRLTDDLRSIHGRERLLVSIDQEGGRVARLRPPHWAAYPAGEAFDRLYEVAPASAIEAARAGAKAMGLELSAMGITVDYHPPLDLRQMAAHDVIGDRSLGAQFKIGHSYVTPMPGDPIPDAKKWFRGIVETEIAPLLEEYWFDNLDKAASSKARLLEAL